MQNQINLQRGDAVFFEGMYYYYPLGHQMNTVPSAQNVGLTFRQHQTKAMIPQISRLIRNQVSLSTTTKQSVLPTVPFYWIEQSETNKAGK